MGKCLIIKGADFSQNAVANLNSVTDITSQVVSSQTHRQYLHTPGSGFNDAFQYSSTALASSVISTLDVSSLRGRTLIAEIYGIGTKDSQTGGLWQICFASSVSVTLPWTGTSSVNPAVTAVERVDGQGTNAWGTYTIVVPQTATYLVFKNRTDYPAKIYLVNE